MPNETMATSEVDDQEIEAIGDMDFMDLLGMGMSPPPGSTSGRSNSVRTESETSSSSNDATPMSMSLSPPSSVSMASPSSTATLTSSSSEAASSPESDLDGKCAVCKEKAGNHSYYGGKVCPSCRAFFRRAVQSKYYEIFFCAKNESCEINLKTRRSCQFCRFKKCLDAGMRTAWVLPEGERKKRFNKLSKIPYRNNFAGIGDSGEDDKNTVSLLPTPQIGELPVLKLTLDDALKIGKMIEELDRGCRKNVSDYPSVYTEVAKTAYCRKNFTFDLLQSFYWMCESSTKTLIATLEDFSSISYQDQHQILKFNTPLVRAFKAACNYDEEEYGIAKTLEDVTKSGEHPAFEPIRQCLETNKNTSKPIVSYSQVYISPWLASYADEVRHKELIFKIKKWLKPKGEAKPDQVLVALGKCMLAFNTNFLELQQRDIVEGLQMRCLNLLRNYLRARYNDRPEASAKFAEGLRVISYAREVSEIEKHRLPI